jgi:predicted Zn-dependent protease
MRYLLNLFCLNGKTTSLLTLRWKVVIVCVIYFSNIASAIETNFPDLGASSETILEAKNERLIGDMIMQKIHGSDFLIADPVVNEYLHEIGLNFTSQPHFCHINLDIFGVNTPEFNAFAFFGGHIAVHSGLLLGVNNESELVAVLAHETAHITQRHLARIMDASRQMMPLTAAELLAAIAVGALGAPDAGIHLATAAMAGHMQNMINFTREHEKEADRVGIQMLSQTSFDPNAMATVFQHMKKSSQYQTKPPEYLLTHPVYDSRIADAQNRAAAFTHKQATDSLSFHLIRARLEVATEESTHKKIQRLKDKLDSGRYQNKIAAEYAYALSLLKSPKQENEGLSRLQKLNTQHPNQWILELSLAEAEHVTGQPSSALNRTKRLSESYPSNYAIILQYAMLLLHNKQPEIAIKLLIAECKMHFNDPLLHQMLARAYSLSHQKIELHRSQAEWHFARGEFKDAFKQLDLALEYTPNNKSLSAKIHQRKKTMQAIIEQQKDLKL